MLDEAKSRPVTSEDIISNLNKTDIYPFTINANVIVQGNPFIVNSLLNGLRSKLYQEIFYKKILKKCDTIVNFDNFSSNDNSTIDNKLCVIINKNIPLPNTVTDVVVCPTNYKNISEFESLFKLDKRVWLYLPPFVSGSDLLIIDKILDKFYGVYGEGYWSLEYCKNKNVRLFAGVGFNVFNKVDDFYLKEFGAINVTVSKELKFSEVRDFSKNNFVLSRGGIELMDLIYCPISKTCDNCKLSNEFILKDTDNREFKVVRYSIDGCRFKIFNCSTLLFDVKNYNQIYDLRSISNLDSNEILSNLSIEELKNKIKNYTAGNYIKGTI